MRSCSFPLKEIVVARFDVGEDLLLGIQQVVIQHNVKAGMFTVIGAVDQAHYGFYDPGKKLYATLKWKPTTESSPALEILSCVGNVARLDGDVVVHAHITLSGEKGEIMGGHLLEGCRVNPTGELTLLIGEGVLTRKRNESLNLALLSI
ncbi:MAG: PPC domain-containing DNA-binding protein [Candidatus Hermodarchaeia archaeon]|jgi:predicted DNA-binding protein with PD1-like motif